MKLKDYLVRYYELQCELHELDETLRWADNQRFLSVAATIQHRLTDVERELRRLEEIEVQINEPVYDRT